MVLAADRDQAGVLLGYVRGLIAGNPMLAQLATGESVERIELGTLRVAIEVHTVELPGRPRSHGDCRAVR